MAAGPVTRQQGRLPGQTRCGAADHRARQPRSRQHPRPSGSLNFFDGYNDKAGIIIESDDGKYFALDSDKKSFPILPWDPSSTVGIPLHRHHVSELGGPV